MKINKKIMAKITTILALLTVIGVFTQCVAENATEIGSSNKNTYTPPPGEKDEAQILNEAQVELGIRNHEQIYYTMSVLTGIPTNNGTVKGTYNRVTASLPTYNDVKLFQSSHQLAVVTLASEFCNVLVGNATLRSNIWPNFNFGQNPSVAFSVANRDYLISEGIHQFWGDMISDTERWETEQSINELIDELLEGETNNTTTTANVVKGVCTTFLSSAQVTLL